MFYIEKIQLKFLLLFDFKFKGVENLTTLIIFTAKRKI